MNGKRKINNGNSSYFIVIFIAIILFALTIFSGFYRSYKVEIIKENKPVNTNIDQSIKILFVGDMMLDRNVRNIIDKKSFKYFFAGVEDIIKSADIAVVNLEGTFTTNKSVTTVKGSTELKFTFDPGLASATADLGFDIIGLANNHSSNFGTLGLNTTRRYVGESGILYYGDPNNKDEISTTIVQNGINVGFVGFHEFSYVNYNKVFLEIARLRPLVDILIVTPHWGVEYDKKPTEKQVKWAHEFIDLGADAVIGTHSHVIGDIEEYNGKKIFYSLGNFAFDQYFSKETMEGLGVVMNINKRLDHFNINYSMIPIIVDGKGTRVSSSTSPVVD
jgi:poly-gamma-glutamate synthesis protein (capsule biosynthesis protein)